MFPATDVQGWRRRSQSDSPRARIRDSETPGSKTPVPIRTVHSREATRALFILEKVTGSLPLEALGLCGTVRETAQSP